MSKSLSLVIIGCKMPSGLALDFGNPGEAGHKQIKLNGANQGEIREGGLFVAQTVGGFGRTTLDRDTWERWKVGADIRGEATQDPRTGAELMSAERATAALVSARKALLAEWQEKGLVWEVDDSDLAIAQANDKAGVKSGFEPLLQVGDTRAPRKITKAA